MEKLMFFYIYIYTDKSPVLYALSLLQTRPAIVGAPYVLCVFVVGVVLLLVGTFVTSHGHREDGTSDPAPLVVGPVLLGIGCKLWEGRDIDNRIGVRKEGKEYKNGNKKLEKRW